MKKKQRKTKRRKPLTLDKVWKLCLAQWDCIIKQRKDHYASVIELKEEWVNHSEYRDERIKSNCFFCERNARCKRSMTVREFIQSKDCNRCPGKLINPRFDCQKDAYHYYFKPEKFYAKLQRMYKKYKAQKGE